MLSPVGFKLLCNKSVVFFVKFTPLKDSFRQCFILSLDNFFVLYNAYSVDCLGIWLSSSIWNHVEIIEGIVCKIQCFIPVVCVYKSQNKRNALLYVYGISDIRENVCKFYLCINKLKDKTNTLLILTLIMTASSSLIWFWNYSYVALQYTCTTMDFRAVKV